MKKVIIEEQDSDTINLADISEITPIFAKKGDKFCGMVVKEEEKGWILRLGGSGGCCGWHKTRWELLESATTYGYKFFT